MKRTTEIAIDSFLDGFTGAGLFGRLRRPGAPTEFVDSRTLEEIRECGEFAENIAYKETAKYGQRSQNATGQAVAERLENLSTGSPKRTIVVNEK
jgi:hypothetical protein